MRYGTYTGAKYGSICTWRPGCWITSAAPSQTADQSVNLEQLTDGGMDAAAGR
ncbi:MAG: hypothetical protein IPO81_21445 [Kouleothrix sp.]|nr:hypothetical protein [Kouleothrix sp.]